MAKRPEALSPGLRSVVSQQIAPSLTFSWNFIHETATDKQKSATARIYAVGGSSPLVTLTVGTAQEVFMGTELAKLTAETTYEWTVEITNTKNEKALSLREKFNYGAVSTGAGEMMWPEGPDAYEYIGTRQYFNEIKANAKVLLTETGAAALPIMAEANKLFTGEVVPSRSDFDGIEAILSHVAEQKNSYNEKVAKLIEDGLGANDIHKIYKFFDDLVKLGPVSASNISLSFAKSDPLEITGGTLVSKGIEDLSIDLKWTVSTLQAGTASLKFGNTHSEDMSYYEVYLQSGFSDFLVDRRLYYRVEDVLFAGGVYTFKMDHYNFHHASTKKQTKYMMRAIAYNLQGAASPVAQKSYDVKDVALGAKNYQLVARKMDLTRKTVIKTWYAIYNGLSKAYVHNAGKSDGIYEYAVKLTDFNNNIGPYYYFPGYAKVDPLWPPAPPKPTVKSVSTDSITFTWPAVKEADSYELSPAWLTMTPKLVTVRTHVTELLEENTKYTMKIRSKNKAGVSAWVSITGKTLARPIVEYVQKTPKCRTWRTNYTVLLQSGRTLHKAGGYMPEKDNVEVMHGEWIELRDKYESGSYVRKGTRWGNHKSVFFLDYSGWQTRLKGKEIISVQLYIKRKNTQHGYPDDGRFLHVYTHNYAGAANLPKTGSGPSMNHMYKATGLDFDRNQGNWVTLPKAFGERLRDGQIKGIGFHHPASTRTPYSYIRFDARTFQFKVKYK